MAANGISTLASKTARRNQKLLNAANKRKTSGTPGYRPLNTIVGSHSAYVGTAIGTVSGSASPTIGHPWTV